MRELTGRSAKVYYLVCLAWSLILSYTASVIAFHPIIQGITLFALFALTLVFMVYPAKKGEPLSGSPSNLDILLIILSIVTCTYVLFRYEIWMVTPLPATNFDVFLSGILLILILEAARRTIGWFLPTMTIILLLYAFLGQYIPGTYGHKGFSIKWVLGNLYTSTSGYAGIVTWIVSTVVAIFIIAGAVILKSGLGETLIDGAKVIAGRIRGGAALMAVVASSFFGTVSGSPIANAATTGAITIPMMKRLGYRSKFAAAVEAVASTGGQIMPPIMGAGAFIMAEMLGISYLKVCIAALVPAVLYFLGVGMGIYFEASRVNLARVPKEEIPKTRSVFTWVKMGPLGVFMVVLFYFLIQGRPVQQAGFRGVVTLIVLFIFTTGEFTIEGIKGRLRKMVDAFALGGKNLASLAVIILCVQVVINMVNLTGLGIKFSALIYIVAGTNLLLALIFVGVIAMLLGMELPTTAAYLVGISVLGSCLIGLGFPPLATNLFIFYYAILAVITPPICFTVYVASNIAESKWLPTGFMAWRLGLAAYIVPLMFMYNPVLILKGKPFNIVAGVATAIIGVIALASGSMGFLLKPTAIYERLILITSALLLIFASLITDLIGIGLIAIALLSQGVFARHRTIFIS